MASEKKGKVQVKQEGKAYSGDWELTKDGKVIVNVKNGEMQEPFKGGDPVKVAEKLLKNLIEDGAFGGGKGAETRPITEEPDAGAEKPKEPGPKGEKQATPLEKGPKAAKGRGKSKAEKPERPITAEPDEKAEKPKEGSAKDPKDGKDKGPSPKKKP